MGMNSTEQTTWQQDIAEAARASLTADGAVVVRLGARQAPEVVSRLYPAGATYRSTAWGRATKMRNEDGTGANYYVVTSHEDAGIIVVWNGRHSFLCEVAR